jgi:hypothetical protein
MRADRVTARFCRREVTDTPETGGGEQFGGVREEVEEAQEQRKSGAGIVFCCVISYHYYF